MGQALYRKYRPKSLKDVVGQEHITTALSNAIKKGKINHAYLFTGPKGVGKTSIARILAHEVNGLPYDDDSAHLDIIEIDAASNRRIEEIRDLRDHVHVSPTQTKYKVYIIDEVHMLTREAFNALLKTLEEPPAHVIFILATTEAHKLPETIISRCMRFSFKPIEKDKVVEHLQFIAKKERITIDNGALELIAEHGEGSFRDSIGLLDQAVNTSSKITADEIRIMLGIAPREVIEQLVSIIESGTPQQLLETLEELHQRGFHAPSLAKQLSSFLRQAILKNDNLPIPTEQLMELMRQLLSVSASVDPEAMLELVLLGIVLEHTQISISMPTKPTTPVQVNTEPSAQSISPHAKKTTEPEPIKPSLQSPQKPQHPTDIVLDKLSVRDTTGSSSVATGTTSAKTPEALDEIWTQVLTSLKQSHNTLYGIVRMAEPSLDGEVLTLGFRFPFHQKRVSETKNKQVITALIIKISGQNIRLECVVQKTSNEPKISEMTSGLQPAPASTPTTIDTISNIFGGAELLDS